VIFCLEYIFFFHEKEKKEQSSTFPKITFDIGVSVFWDNDFF